MNNPALADLAPLVGQWRMELYNAAFLPEPHARLTGSLSVEWIEDGAAIVMRQGESEKPPAAIWFIGRDDGSSGFQVFYADDRGVSRIYQMSFAAPDWKMWRSTREFSQRFEANVSTDGNMIKGVWTKSIDGGNTWEHDFNIDYTRALPSES